MSRLNFLCKHVYENSKAEIMVYKLNKEEKTKLDSRVGFIFKELIDVFQTVNRLIIQKLRENQLNKISFLAKHVTSKSKI